jgi:antitoxin component YwqK of YwqJK toxin-antitoxin module
LIEQYSWTVHIINQSGNIKMTTLLKKWCYYLDGKIIKREAQGNTCYTKFYHQNGKIQSRGTTVLDTSTNIHWFYSGNWKFYDNKGKLIIERIIRVASLLLKQS